MIRPLRRRHFWLVAIIAVVALVLFLAALAARPERPYEENLVEAQR